jgi:hypothetical protein
VGSGQAAGANPGAQPRRHRDRRGQRGSERRRRDPASLGAQAEGPDLHRPADGRDEDQVPPVGRQADLGPLQEDPRLLRHRPRREGSQRPLDHVRPPAAQHPREGRPAVPGVQVEHRRVQGRAAAEPRGDRHGGHPGQQRRGQRHLRDRPWPPRPRREPHRKHPLRPRPRGHHHRRLRVERGVLPQGHPRPRRAGSGSADPRPPDQLRAGRGRSSGRAAAAPVVSPASRSASPAPRRCSRRR